MPPFKLHKNDHVLQDGEYMTSTEDLGYQSSLSSPNESQMRKNSPANKHLLHLQKVNTNELLYSPMLATSWPDIAWPDIAWLDVASVTAGL